MADTIYDPSELKRLDAKVRACYDPFKEEAKKAKKEITDGATTGDQLLDWAIYHLSERFYSGHHALVQANPDLIAHAGEKFLLQHHCKEMAPGADAAESVCGGEDPYIDVVYNWLGVLGSGGLGVRRLNKRDDDRVVLFEDKGIPSLFLDHSHKTIFYKSDSSYGSSNGCNSLIGDSRIVQLSDCIDPILTRGVGYEDKVLTFNCMCGHEGVKSVNLIFGPKLEEEIAKYICKDDFFNLNLPLDPLLIYFQK